MMISQMPTVLAWKEGTGTQEKVFRSYVSYLSRQYGLFWGRVRRDGSVSNEELGTVLEYPQDDLFLRVLLAPETSFRILWPRRNSVTETASFLRSSLEAERHRTKCTSVDLRDVKFWSALGDFAILSDEATFEFNQIPGFAPLDFGSPYAQTLDISGQADRRQSPNPQFSCLEQRLVFETINAAVSAIGNTSKTIYDFCVRFNLAVVLQKDPDSSSFSSGSTRQFVGRSCLGNPQLANAADIANAVVHEAIHSLLYMQEIQREWVLDPDLTEHVPRVFSPWTGRKLALRPYLQACFVWYGLLHFWSEALKAEAFPEDWTLTWFKQCLVGFLDEPLLKYVKDYREHIIEDVLEAIAQIDANVKSLTPSLVRL